MYVDPKPVSTYGEPPGWAIPMPTPSPQPPGSLKRPPLLSNASSSSSLSGMEQAVPSFRSFISRTPPPDPSKPLPPTPLIPRRASSASPPRSGTTSIYRQRRSSSVYSRTVSQWFGDDSSWRSVDLRDDPMPEMPPLTILQPVAYSKSTPQLIERPATPPPPFLEPRMYRPLITTPSPTASRVTTPNRSPVPSPGPPPLPQPQQQPATYSTPPSLQHTPKKSVHTVSLEQAKAAVHSPGAVHLLPEELRAQQHMRSRSHELVRVPTLDFFESASPPQAPMPPMPATLVDTQGRHRSLQAKDPENGSRHPFLAMCSHPLSSPKTVAPLEMQPREASKVKAANSLGLDGDEEPRGRTRQRGPRSKDYSHYIPNGRQPASTPSPVEGESDARKVASEYHHLLSEQYRQPSICPAHNSDDSIRAHMKMVPQPLFKNRPAAKLPGSVIGRGSERGSNASESPFHLRADSVASKASATTQGSLPLQLSLTPDSIDRRTSATGSIPISPPPHGSSVSFAPADRPVRSTGSPKKQKSPRKSEDNRVSMYYPYVGPRKGKKAKEMKGAKETDRPVPRMPLLPANVIAQRLQTPEASAESSPLRSTASVSFKDNASNRKDSNASLDRQRTPLFQRLAGNAVKYADLITRPSGPSEARTHQSKTSDSTAASPHSPHLLPSPSKTNPPPVHLGWSDTAKTTFDRSRSSMQSASASPPTPQSTHFTNLPARLLDERYAGLSEPYGRGRKGSIAIFGSLLDGWKERKKEEKREELKKIIRVVPQQPPARMQTMDVVPPAPGLLRQASMGTGVEHRASRQMPGGLSRRMSALGWM